MARPIIPVLTMQEPRSFTPMNWLLVPPWVTSTEKAKELKIWTANARIEELEDKKLYRGLTEGNRCLVLFGGFYEWKHEDDGKKTKYFVQLDGDEPMFLAALWNESTIDGETYRSVSVCTMEARNAMRYVHNKALRQPVVVPYRADFVGGSAQSAGATWLDTKTPLEIAREAVLSGEKSADFAFSPPVPTDL